MAQVLLEEINPLGNVQAVVECDERTCYFYLYGAEETGFGVKSVWVRNLVPAPAELDVASMREGLPPLNPSQFCRDTQSACALSADDLRVVWLPEGNGAALFEADSMLAAIPPWSGHNGMYGYARDCVGQGPLAWDLADATEFVARIENAERFTQTWEAENAWADFSDRLLEIMSARFGKHSKYYAIDGGYWPPKALIRFDQQDHCVLLTVGLSILPQPNVDMVCDEPALIRRIEFGAVLPSGWSDHEVQRFGGYLSSQSNLPWQQLTWLGHGHTIQCNAWRNQEFTHALLVHDHALVHTLDLGCYMDDPISILWFTPVAEAEVQQAISHGSDSVMTTLPASRWMMA